MRKSTILYCLFVFLIANQSCKKDSNPVQPAAGAANDNLAIDTVAITDSSLLCYLPFNSNLKDKSGHNNNGNLVGNISYIPDRFGKPSKAASFSASNAYIEIPEADFVGLKNVTISMDFYPTSTNQQELLSKMSYSATIGSPGFYQSFSVNLRSDGIIGFQVRQKDACAAAIGTGWSPTLYSSTGVIYNSWNHIAITFNNSEQKLYLNGNLVAVDIKTSSPICQGEPIRLAVWWQSDPEYFTGNMDEVRIYNRVLSKKEIKQLSAL